MAESRFVFGVYVVGPLCCMFYCRMKPEISFIRIGLYVAYV